MPVEFRAALLAVPPRERDAWVDRVLGLDGVPDDGPALPPGCVPYLPCAADLVLRAVDGATLRATDVFVDLGAGVGRAAALAHLLTGARAIGIEIQPHLVRIGRDLTARLGGEALSILEGDVTGIDERVASGTVFFLYCPFSGPRLSQVLADLEALARVRRIRICTVDLPLPPCDWLERRSSPAEEPAIYRSKVPFDAR